MPGLKEKLEAADEILEDDLLNKLKDLEPSANFDTSAVNAALNELGEVTNKKKEEEEKSQTKTAIPSTGVAASSDNKCFQKVIFITTAQRDAMLKTDNHPSFEQNTLYIQFVPSTDNNKTGLAFFYQNSQGEHLNYFPNCSDVSKVKLESALKNGLLEGESSDKDSALNVFSNLNKEKQSKKYEISAVQTALNSCLLNRNDVSKGIELKDLKTQSNYVEYKKKDKKHIFNFPANSQYNEGFFKKLQTEWFIPVGNEEDNLYAKIKILNNGKKEFTIEAIYKSKNLAKPSEG